MALFVSMSTSSFLVIQASSQLAMLPTSQRQSRRLRRIGTSLSS